MKTHYLYVYVKNNKYKINIKNYKNKVKYYGRFIKQNTITF